MDLLVGYQLDDRYQILSRMGQGSLGTVYWARDAQLGRDVALKVLHPFFARQPDFQKRFKQEAQIAIHLKHPGLIQVLDAGQSQSFYFIVMELIQGGNLRAKMDRQLSIEAAIPLAEAVELIRQVLQALEYAHGMGVIHRDLKPTNILIRPGGGGALAYSPVISDLGLAKLLGSELETQEGVVTGAPAYLSPEQAGGEEVDQRSDLYSLGVILYELATGRLPFPIKTMNEAIRYHAREIPPSPRTIRNDIPKDLESVILKALEKAPEARYSSAAQFAAALQGLPLLESLDKKQEKREPWDRTLVGSGETPIPVVSYSQRRLKTAGGKIRTEETFEPPDLVHDYVLVLSPSRAPEFMAVNPGGMIVGRDVYNDILLNDPYVAGRHARIEYREENKEYWVTDLNSGHGTFLGEARLLPGVAEPWLGNMVLRVGEAELHLYRKPEQSTPPPVPGSQPGSSPEVRLLEFAHLSLDKQEVTVEPGGSATLTITIVNRTNRPDRYLVSVDGIQPTWLANRQFEVGLNPLGQQEIPLIIRPQRKPTSHAKDYPFTVQATSKANPGPIARVNGMLKVSRFYQFSCNLTPEKFPVNQSSQLDITNLGNTAEIYTAKFENPANELKFQWTEKVTIEPGMTKAMKFQAALEKIRWVGDAKSHLLTAEVTSTSSGETQTFQGEAVSKGLFPNWALVVAALILLALLALVVLRLTGLFPRGLIGQGAIPPSLEGALALLTLLLPA